MNDAGFAFRPAARTGWSRPPHSDAPVAESILALHAALAAQHADGAPAIHVLVSARKGDGTSSIARDLARVAAWSRDVLLVDCAARAASVHHRLALADSFRLGQPLAQARPLAGPHNAMLARGAHPLLDMASADTAALFASVRRRFALTLLDCPSLDNAPTALMLARHCDSVLLVTRAGRTPLRAADAARISIERHGGHVAGVVLNRHRRALPAWLARFL